MAVNQRRRVATILNFLSFISIDIKGFSFNFGRKIFTGFEMAELESYTSTFFLYFITLNVKKMLQLSSSAVSKPVKNFLPKLMENPFITILMNDTKLRIVATLLL